ncbi:putative cytochrome P450 [Paramyrothecium foliicola]|nr:putative cytochrome P450 [Paramyrothecium foliicola]
MVVVNDSPALQAVFARQDLNTSPPSVRALRIGGHHWTVTIPQNYIARGRRHAVMSATITRVLKYWRPTFESNVQDMVRFLGRSKGTKAEDIVHVTRSTTFQNAQMVVAGSNANVEPGNFARVVAEYIFLVDWRLVFPNWSFEWLRFGPFKSAKARLQSDEDLYNFGHQVYEEAQNMTNEDHAEVATVYGGLMNMDKNQVQWTPESLSAEISGVLLAATETTSTGLAFIFYELAKQLALIEKLYEEIQDLEDYDDLEELPMLNACIIEGLRFRPPAAFTASRVASKGGIDIMGYQIPEGTTITTQSLSMSRQRPDIFPNYDTYDPTRWLDIKDLSERRKMVAPFGIGARRCPGSNMALYQMRIIVGAVIKSFQISVAPGSTPDKMRMFEANGFRCGPTDECFLVFKPRLVG